jgi:hypothetical protein
MISSSTIKTPALVLILEWEPNDMTSTSVNQEGTMQLYWFTFKGPGSDRFCEKETRVKATTEENARHEAMVARWGEPDGDYGPTYEGKGLELIDKKPIRIKAVK